MLDKPIHPTRPLPCPTLTSTGYLSRVLFAANQYPGTVSSSQAEQTGKPLWASEDMDTCVCFMSWSMMVLQTVHWGNCFLFRVPALPWWWL